MLLCHLRSIPFAFVERPSLLGLPLHVSRSRRMPLEVTTDGHNIIISPQKAENAESDLLDALDTINRKHGSVLRKLGQ